MATRETINRLTTSWPSKLVFLNDHSGHGLWLIAFPNPVEDSNRILDIMYAEGESGQVQ